MRGSWYDFLQPLLEEHTPKIYQKLKQCEGEVYPHDQSLIYNCFNQFEVKDLKTIVIMQDPYHSKGCANGLCAAVAKDKYCPPSLRNILTEIKEDIGTSPAIETALEKKDYREVWGTKQASQGVLLLNTALTVERGKPGSHLEIWRKFTKNLIIKLLTETTDVVWLLWGRPAQKLWTESIEHIKSNYAYDECGWTNNIKNCHNIKDLDITDGFEHWEFKDGMEYGDDFIIADHYALKTSHPSPFSANKKLSDCPAFIGSQCFSNCNEILSKLGKTEIQW